MPKESENLYPYFVKGQPIASIKTDSAFILLSLDRILFYNYPYFRLWLLYQNLSENPYLLTPQQFISLSVLTTKYGQSEIGRPVLPTKLLASISNRKTMSLILQGIAGSLEEMSTRPTTATTKFRDGSSFTTTYNDRGEKNRVIADRTIDNMASTSMWYDIYQNSISDEILRKNTIFPGQSVNGYIYIPYPKIKKHANLNDDISNSQDKSTITVKILLPDDSLFIKFNPIEGE